MSNFNAFTVKHKVKVREIITQIGVSIPFVSGDIAVSVNDPRIYRTSALWDTGATNCVITANTAKELNLKPISMANVSHADGVSLVNVYLVNIYLPNNMVIPNVRVSECADNDGFFGVIVGMDIITMGDFAVTNAEHKTIVSFRIPSIKTVDYVHEANN